MLGSGLIEKNVGTIEAGERNLVTECRTIVEIIEAGPGGVRKTIRHIGIEERAECGGATLVEEPVDETRIDGECIVVIESGDQRSARD